jgi:Zn-dependent protease with chaperone function
MANSLVLLTSWLTDFYVLAMVLLAAERLAASLTRRPARRLALARAALIGLAVLAVLLALPDRARLGLGLVAGGPADLRLPLAGLYLGGLLLTGAWLLLGAGRAWLLARRSQPAPGHLRELLDGVVAESGAQPGLRVDAELQQPVALGAWRPLLLLPAPLTHAPARQLEAVLAHEWAHIKNGDLRWAALSRLLLLALFAHPLFWLLRRRMRADQEMQADAAAAARAGVIDYATTLVGIAGGGSRLDSTLPAATIPRPLSCTPLKRRIAALLHPDFCAEDRWAPGLHIAAAVLTVVAVTLLSPVTLRELGEPSMAAADAVTPAMHASAAPVPPAVVVKLEVVLRTDGNAPLQRAAADPPADRAKPREPRTPSWSIVFFRWWSDHQAEWLYRLLRWYAEHLYRQ